SYRPCCAPRQSDTVNSDRGSDIDSLVASLPGFLGRLRCGRMRASSLNPSLASTGRRQKRWRLGGGPKFPCADISERARDHWHRRAHSLPSGPRSEAIPTTRRGNAVKPSDMLVIGLLAAVVSAAMPAAAQERYPLRPVRLVIPSVPAGVHDVIGRVWAERVKPLFGAIVIDNRGGGARSIGGHDVAHSPPRRYSILLRSTTTHVLVTPVMANPPYDPVKDFSAVTVFAYSSTSIVVNPSLPARTLAELIAYAKANPGKLSYGSAGTGSITHIAGEYFKQLAGRLAIVAAPHQA